MSLSQPTRVEVGKGGNPVHLAVFPKDAPPALLAGIQHQSPKAEQGCPVEAEESCRWERPLRAGAGGREARDVSGHGHRQVRGHQVRAASRAHLPGKPGQRLEARVHPGCCLHCCLHAYTCP